MVSVEPAEDHEVWGVVYGLTAADFTSLDSLDGYRADSPATGNRYNRVAFVVTIDGVPTEVESYVAVSTQNPPPPSTVYLAHLRDGARHHGLPEGYRAFLDGLK